MDTEDKNDCDHYQRKCLLVAPCCGKTFACRLCHDNVENHQLIRQNVETIVCSQCNESQKVSRNCLSCGILFGKYSCLICRLYDDVDKGQFHCDQCGICRVGGKEGFFHCTKCNMCLSISLKEGHKCLLDASKKNCPVCLEDIHTSRKPVHVPKCSHLMHMECYTQMLTHGNYTCPECNQSLVDMSGHWRILDLAVAETTMPVIYQNYHVNILCRDCQKESKVNFHIVGLKCEHCGGYNTTRIGGDDPLPEDPSNVLQELVDELNVEGGQGSDISGDEGVEEGWETVSEGDADDTEASGIITNVTEESDDDVDNENESVEEGEVQVINDDVNRAMREDDS